MSDELRQNQDSGDNPVLRTAEQVEPDGSTRQWLTKLLLVVLGLVEFLGALAAVVGAVWFLPRWTGTWLVFAPADERLINLPSNMLLSVSVLLLIIAIITICLPWTVWQARHAVRNGLGLAVVAGLICLNLWLYYKHLRQPYQLAVFRTSERTRDSIVKAASVGDITTVTRLLDEGADPNSYAVVPTHVSDMPPTVLISALEIKNSAIASLLLSRGADPELAGDARLPVDEAMGNDDIKSLDALFKAGARVDGEGEWIPLHYAVQFCSPYVLAALLKYHPNLERKNSAGMTAAQWAIWVGREDNALVLKSVMKEKYK